MSNDPISPSPEDLQLAAELDAAVDSISTALRHHDIVLTERPTQAMMIITLTSMLAQGCTFAAVMEYAASVWDALKPQVEAAMALAAMPVTATVHG